MPHPPLIACVDDDSFVREALEGWLRSLGLDVAVHESAEEFLASPQLDCVSCLISDLMLGGMSGLRMQEHLVASGHRIPTIVITAYADDEMRARVFEAGAVACLRKPIASEELLSALRLALGA